TIGHQRTPHHNSQGDQELHSCRQFSELRHNSPFLRGFLFLLLAYQAELEGLHALEAVILECLFDFDRLEIATGRRTLRATSLLEIADKCGHGIGAQANSLDTDVVAL